ncbi:hypothetical protein [Aquimarina sp. 2201CG14-23]|uniref:hypothetical protein n=1 Tax=Aquimarina mycalae TaxID=3040073 RepID=UPI0024782884|nr:hypothetical protein [Aquimarina sp. 2201CG14-23]MDH7446089.1 hypothetical protein [Aquimarina sp. 2201CG14-23]
MKKLNNGGKTIVKNVKPAVELKSKMIDFMMLYSSYTGASKGYSFFSPNVGGESSELLFIADGERVDFSLLSEESFLKFKTASYFFKSRMEDEELRELILKSMSAYLFNGNPEIEQIDIYLDLYKVEDLKKVKDHGFRLKNKKILGFTACKQSFEL